MNDFAFLAIILAFFALLALFVAACDRIIGPDEEGLGRSTAETAEDKVRGVSGDDIVGLIIAVALLAYLVFALISPEKL